MEKQLQEMEMNQESMLADVSVNRDSMEEAESLAMNGNDSDKKVNRWAEMADSLNGITASMLGKAKKAAVKIADQNDDNVFDKEDMSIVMDNIGEAAHKAATAVKETIAESARQRELQTLMPIFREDIESSDFMMPKFIRVTDIDKKHAESEQCKNSIGHYTNVKDMKLLNVYYDRLDTWGLTFYPDSEYEFYYADPADRNQYIALDEFFSYLKLARISELQTVAKSLGAKHIKLTYKEEQIEFSKRRVKAKADGKVSYATSDMAKGNIDANLERSMKDSSGVQFASEIECEGHDPIYPQLHYLKLDPSVHTLIDSRMDTASPTKHYSLSMNFKDSAGMKENDAVKIDAILKNLKCTVNATVVGEAKNEERRVLVYEIDF